MSNLTLTTAIGNYGYTETLKDDTIKPEHFSFDHVEISPVPMIFRRMVRNLEFDVAEMALSTYICAKYYEKQFTALPIFLTRSFYHGAIVCNKSANISKPTDLSGKRVGVRSYTLTPGVWTRALLQTEYGLDLDTVTWVLSGDEHVEEYTAPDNVISSDRNDLAEMLTSGEVDAVIGAGQIDSDEVIPLFTNAYELDTKWFAKTNIYPISHLLVVKDQVLRENPWLESKIFNIFTAAKDVYLKEMRSTQKPDARDELQLNMSKIVNGDPIPYGFQGDRSGLEAFVKFNVDQSIIPEYISPEKLFEMP
ncbi:MAG TPA: ABC transporter substrate-binding protein [Dehalococcoidia bacterium]|nr:ABC transporter substrate-binding protein [Dehalococcoidia bacterium]